MSPDLILTKQLLYDPLDFTLSDFIEESESKEYSASTFVLNGIPVKFRTAKITPTKTGAFVTLWKRNATGITCPHNDTDPFNFYVISVRKEDFFGQFVFPKSALIKQGVLSRHGKEGKRGFRVYPDWERVENKQAEKTQKWQSEFFLEINDGKNLNLEKAKSILKTIAL
ncbi:MepB family protein [Sphingobacteriaceae bacterium]|nr:MepB family protein [Sphingobacteriaceae bacterium]